jgi:hypothetical protein
MLVLKKICTFSKDDGGEFDEELRILTMMAISLPRNVRSRTVALLGSGETPDNKDHITDVRDGRGARPKDATGSVTRERQVPSVDQNLVQNLRYAMGRRQQDDSLFSEPFLRRDTRWHDHDGDGDGDDDDDL